MPRPQPQQVGQLRLGGESLQLVDVVQDQQQRSARAAPRAPPPAASAVSGSPEVRTEGVGRRPRPARRTKSGPDRSSGPAVNQAAGRGLSAAARASSVVLPDPGGAITTTTPGASSPTRGASSRGRRSPSGLRPVVVRLGEPRHSLPFRRSGQVVSSAGSSSGSARLRRSRHRVGRCRTRTSAWSVMPSRSLSIASGLVPSAISAASVSWSWSVSASRGSSPCWTSNALLRLSASSSPAGSSPFREDAAARPAAASSATFGSVRWISSTPSLPAVPVAVGGQRVQPVGLLEGVGQPVAVAVAHCRGREPGVDLVVRRGRRRQPRGHPGRACRRRHAAISSHEKRLLTNWRGPSSGVEPSSPLSLFR